MATELQKALAREIIKNSKLPPRQRKNKKNLLVSVGYDKLTAEKQPGFILEQKGVKEELENLGFTTENANKVVSNILLDKKVRPSDRLKAAELVYKVKGDFAPEKHLSFETRIVKLDI